MGFNMGDRSFIDLRYADDTALIYDSIENYMSQILTKVDEAGKRTCLHLNAINRKVVTICMNNHPNITKNNTRLDHVEQFKYLESKNKNKTKTTRPAVQKTLKKGLLWQNK